jgi:hypothetical protein
MVTTCLRPKPRCMNGGDVADSSKDAVLASDQLSYKLKTYTSGCTDDTPSFLSGLAIQDLGYLVHVSNQGMDIDPNDEGASDPDTSIAKATMGFWWRSRTEEALSRVQPTRRRKYMMDHGS